MSSWIGVPNEWVAFLKSFVEIFPTSLNFWSLWYIRYFLAQMIYKSKIFFWLKQNYSWKSLYDGSKTRLASSGSKDQGGKNMKWWLIVLADCIQFKNNPRAILIFITEPSTGPVGCFKCFKWNQSQTPGTLRYSRERVSKKMPKTFVSLSFSFLSPLLSLSLSFTQTPT